MLHQRYTTCGLQLADEVFRAGLCVTAKPGTPLAQLDRAIPFVSANPSGVTEITPDLIVQASTGFENPADLSVPATHTSELYTLAKQVGAACGPHLKFARSVANPLIRELLEDFTKQAATYVAKPVGEPIVQYALPEPLRGDLGAQLISSYEGEASEDYQVGLGLPLLSFDQLREYLTTGVVAHDQPVSQWLATIGQNDLDMGQQWVFGHARAKAIISSEMALNFDLLGYLLASRLIDMDPVEGVNQSLGSYRSKLGQIQAECGARLAAAVSNHGLMVGAGVLIKNYSNRQITVYADTYAQFKNEGGHDHLIFAAVRSSKVPTRLDEISEQAGALTARWERLTAAITATESHSRVTAMRNIMYTCLTTLVNNNLQLAYEHLKPGQPVNGQDPRIVEGVAIARAVIFNAGVKDFQDPAELALRIVAGGLFHHTAAYDILSSMREALSSTPDMDSMEASLQATLSYVVRYLIDQLNFQRQA